MLYGGRVPALEHINLTVEKGDWLAVMGPSGSGKTTLMNIIGCMDKHTSGEVILDGINLNEVSKNELTQIRRDKIGMVFQQFHLIPYLIDGRPILSQHSRQERSHGSPGPCRS